MKKKLLVLVAMLLCVVTVLASCASSMKFEKVVGDGTYNDENPTLTAAAKADLKGTYSSLLSKGDLAVFVDTSLETQLSTYTIYNVATGATVLGPLAETKTESGANSTTVKYSINVMEQWETNWFKITTTTTTVTVDETTGTDTDIKKDLKYYTVAGAEFAAISDYNDADLAAAWTKQDLICLDGKVYRIADDGTVAHAFDWNELRAVPSVSKVGDYYIAEAMEGCVAVYDASLNLVTTYMLPSYVAGETEDFGIALSNGNILVQYYVAADEMAEEYSFLMEPELDMYVGPPMKYNLYSFLINAENGKVKELDLDYIVMYAFFKEAGDDSWYYNEKIENVAYVIYIEDQRINFTPDAQKLVSLSNKGKVKGVIEPIDNMLGGLTQVATNRWTAANLAGQVFLLNEKGEVLGEVTKTVGATKTASFFVLNNKIYDWDLNVKVDLIDEKIEGECIIMDHSALFKNEDGEWKLYTNGELKTVIDKATADAGTRKLEYISSSIYAIVDTATEGKTKYEFYNDAGALLIAIEDADIDVEQCLVCTAGSNNAVLIKGLSIPGEGETAKPVYYRVG